VLALEYIYKKEDRHIENEFKATCFMCIAYSLLYYFCFFA
jgi:hypothetical protein